MHFLKMVQSALNIKKQILFLIFFLISTKLLSAPITQSPLYQFASLYEKQCIFTRTSPQEGFSFQATYFQKKGKRTIVHGEKENCAALIFGQSTFQLKELFPEQDTNPLLFIDFSPQLSVHSNGVLFEALYTKQVKENFTFFITAKIPFFRQKISEKQPKNQLSLEKASLQDLFQTKTVNNQTQFAFQLGALSSLPLANTGPGASVSFVSFFDTTFIQPGVSMRGLLVTDAPLANTPIAVTKTDATTPPTSFVYNQTTPTELPVLNNVVDDTAIGEIERFATNTDYRPFAASADLSSFWVIPTATNGIIATNAQKIQLAVQDLISQQIQSTTELLALDDLFLGKKQNEGFAGCEIQSGISYDISEQTQQCGYLLLHLPAERTVSLGNLYELPLHNNGHVGIGIGGTTNFYFKRSIQLFFDYRYLYTAPKTEQMPIPLAGSALIIGPTLSAKRSWHTIYFHPALSLYTQKGNNLFALTAHYRLYHAFQEHITLKQNQENMANFDVNKRASLTDQTIHSFSFDASFEHQARTCSIFLTVSILRAIRAHHAVHENGWSLACAINF